MNQDKLNIAEKEVGLLKNTIENVLQEALILKESLKNKKSLSETEAKTIEVISKKEQEISKIISLKILEEGSVKEEIQEEDLNIIDNQLHIFEKQEAEHIELENIDLKGIDSNIVKEKLNNNEIIKELTLYSLNGERKNVKITTISELEDKKIKKKALHKAAQSYNKEISNKNKTSSKVKQKVKNNERKSGFIEKLIKWIKSKF